MDVDDVFAAAIAPRYRIERTLGEGGMAIVYLARDSRHGRLVALKVLRPEVATTLGAERFLREITIAARLVHPNILPLHDSGEAAGRLYYVMPYVEGATLRQRLDREKQLPLADVADITSQVAAALDYAHGQGVVHRDVKPDNVLLVNDRVLVADFGLARALTSAASSPLTRTGTVVGTPAYMSPEQCAPGEAVDARSDVYALACMTFEMIAGVTPFRGATAQAMMAHQISGEPPSVCAERERCPRAVDEVLKRGLAKSPADRYQRAGEFAAALREGVEGVTSATGAVGSSRRPNLQRRRWMPAGALAIAVVVGGWFAARKAGAGSALDRNVYVVFPLREDSAARVSGLDGDDAAQLLGRAMSNWRGIQMVNAMRVSDMWARGAPSTVEDGLRAAEHLKAGELAWGEINAVGDSLEIHAVAYDVSGGSDASREFRMLLPRTGRTWRETDSVFVALADSIIIGGRGPNGLGVFGTHDVRAWQEFSRGYEALNRFDFRVAQDHFDAATRADENFALAHLWAARVRAWRANSTPVAWLADARQAVRLKDSLSATDRTHALALLDLAEGRAPDACRRYHALTSGDPEDFAAWLGLGDCNALDDVVVRDDRSTTGYAFRGSYHTAVTAYMHALALVPSLGQAERGSVFSRLAHRVLFTEESKLRLGVGVGPDAQRYAAFPSMPGDTLSFVPSPFAQLTRAAAHPATERKAVTWAAETMRTMMKEWLDAFPRSADAQAAYAVALESSSAINGLGAPPPEALVLARQAAAATDSAELQTYRWVTVVRLLVKADSFDAARTLSDSLLAAAGSPKPLQAGYLGNLAALTGRARRAASLLRVAAADSDQVPFRDSNGRPLTLPLDLLGAVLELRVYASLDAPRDSVLAVFHQVDRLVGRSVTADKRATLMRRFLATPIVLATPDLGAAGMASLAGTDDLLAMRAAIESRDRPEARAAGARFITMANSYSPGTVGPDRLLAYARMLLVLGDTAAATEQLEAALDGIPRARTILLEATPQGAVIGRVLLLRAQLAAAARDRATAMRRLSQVDALWRDADAEVRAPIEVLRHQLKSAP